MQGLENEMRKPKGRCPRCSRLKRIDKDGNMMKHKLHGGVLDRSPQPFCKGAGMQATYIMETA